MSDIDIDVLNERMLRAFEEKDKESVLTMLSLLLDMVRTDLEVAKWVSDPKHLNALHEGLVNNFEVKPNSLKLKNREQSRQRRAFLLVSAMANGLKKTNA